MPAALKKTRTPNEEASSPQVLDAIRSSLVRTSMACFTTDKSEPVVAMPHHELMAFVAERDYFGHTVFNAPPGTAKTFWMGNFYSAWRIGNDPDVLILYISATTPHALKQSVNIRNIVEFNPAYRALFPTVTPDKRVGWGQGQWTVARKNTNDPNPTFFAAGIDTSSVLGARADLIIFDDVNTQSQQRSPTQRDVTRDWVANTAETRLIPETGRMINVQTRWHEEDLTGWCISEKWTRLHFKALIDNDDTVQFARLTVYDAKVKNTAAIDLMQHGWQFEIEELGDEERNNHRWEFHVVLHANGPSLWPERFSNEFFFRRRVSRPPMEWACVYQAEPAPEGGNIIPVESLQKYDWNDESQRKQIWTKVVQAWDTAASEKTSADYSVCATFACDRNNHYWLIDLLRERLSFPALKKKMASQFLKHNPSEVLVEMASSGISVVQELRISEDPLLSRIPVVPIAPTEIGRDKVMKANQITGYIAAEKVHVPENAPWSADLFSECSLFPNASHDDVLDAFVLGLWRLVKTSSISSSENWMMGGESVLGNIWEVEW